MAQMRVVESMSELLKPSKMHVLDHSGDRVVEWTAADTAEAEQAFKDHLASGGAVIRTKPGPESQIREFDPHAEELIAIPQIQGG